MAERALLHLTKLDDFAAWCARDGWAKEPNKGVYDALRLRRGKECIVFYSRADAVEHATIPEGPGYRMVRAWLREKKLSTPKDPHEQSH